MYQGLFSIKEGPNRKGMGINMKKLTAFVLIFTILSFLTGCAGPGPKASGETSSAPETSSEAETSSAPDNFAEAAEEPDISGEGNAAGEPDNQHSDKQGEAKPPAGEGSTSAGVFDTGSFQGKVKQASYGGGSNILVQTDRLCLYDTASGSVISAVDYPLDHHSRIQAIDGGFAAMGRQASGGSTGDMTADNGGGFLCILYDRELKETERIDLNKIISSDDFILGESGIAISPDGTKLAVAGVNALYVYDTGSRTTSTLLDFSNQVQSNGFNLVMLSEIAFVSGSSRLAFLASSIPDGREKSIYTYGTIALDGSDLRNFSREGYTVGESLLARKDMLVLPEDFTKAEGQLLIHTVSTGNETVYPLTVSGEGKDGVYLSGQGEYFATAKLEESSVTVRIYECGSGKLLREETVSDANSLYFARIPSILLLDQSRTCIVLLGGRQEDMDTRAASFGF